MKAKDYIGLKITSKCDYVEGIDCSRGDVFIVVDAEDYGFKVRGHCKHADGRSDIKWSWCTEEFSKKWKLEELDQIKKIEIKIKKEIGI